MQSSFSPMQSYSPMNSGMPLSRPQNQNPNIPFDFNKVYGPGNLHPGMMGAANPMGSQSPMGSSPQAPQGGMIGAGLGTLLGGMFGGSDDMNYQNPANAAMPYLNQIPGQMKPYYDPYINAGKSALSGLQSQYGQLTGGLTGLQDQYSQLMNNPGGVMNRIGGSFQESPGYKFQQGQAMNAANNAAAAGGMLGSPQHQQQAAEMTGGLANQDYYNYLNHAMGAYGQGLGGASNLYSQGLTGLQGLNQQGYGASTGLAQNLAQALMSQGNLAYSGQANMNNMEMARRAQEAQEEGSIWGGIGNIAGGIFGGPIGSKIGQWAGSKF